MLFEGVLLLFFQKFHLTFRYLRRSTPLRTVGPAATAVRGCECVQQLLPRTFFWTEERQRQCVNVVLGDATLKYPQIIFFSYSFLLSSHIISIFPSGSLKVKNDILSCTSISVTICISFSFTKLYDSIRFFVSKNN
jgi:hypothetical protein